MALHTLYGTPLSLYTGKARSYLIKNQLPYRERTPTSKHYSEKVLPQAKMVMMPTLETSDGEVIRDGAAIVEHFEAAADHPATPTTPRQRILSRLFDVIGMEGLLRPAMHYRWNFGDENEAFLRYHFASIIPSGLDGNELAPKAMNRMRSAAVSFGVVPEAIPGIEARYLKVLEKLNQHFEVSPYLFGHRPSIGDFSLIAPFYGHLGRDPKPLSIMQARAISVFRWVERMNRPEPDLGEFFAGGQSVTDEDFDRDDCIHDTMIALLQQIAVDFVPETVAAAEFINRWLEAQGDLDPGTPLERGVGLAEFEVEGQALHGLAQPYRFYLLNRVHEDYDSLSPKDRGLVDEMLDRCGMSALIDTRLTRRIGRADNLEVWL